MFTWGSLISAFGIIATIADDLFACGSLVSGKTTFVEREGGRGGTVHVPMFKEARPL